LSKSDKKYFNVITS